MSSKARRALGDLSTNAVSSNVGRSEVVKPVIQHGNKKKATNTTGKDGAKSTVNLPKPTVSPVSDTPLRSVTPEIIAVEPVTRQETTAATAFTFEEEDKSSSLLIYWESTEARKLFRAKSNETVLEAIDDQIKVLTEVKKSTDGWKSIVRVTLRDGEDMEEVISPVDILMLREKARFLSAALEQAKKNKPKFTWDECCKKAIDDIAEKEKNTFFRTSGTLQAHYRKFRDDRKFKFGFWESKSARNLFCAKDDEVVFDAIDDQIKILANVGNSDDGWKAICIVKGKDGIQDLFTPRDVKYLTQKVLYISVALEKAREKMPDHTWALCCQEAINDLAAKNVTTFTSVQAIQKYYRKFREERAFVITEKMLCYDTSWDKATVVVPPGKLGVFLSLHQDSGHPYVTHVDEASTLAGKLSPGDQIIAIDETDVSRMSIAEIKSHFQATQGSERKLTVLVAPTSSGGGKKE